MQGSIYSTLLEMKDFTVGLFSRLNRIMDTVTNSELEVKVKATDAKMVMAGMQNIANRITMGIVLAGLIICEHFSCAWRTHSTSSAFRGWQFFASSRPLPGASGS